MVIIKIIVIQGEGRKKTYHNKFFISLSIQPHYGAFYLHPLAPQRTRDPPALVVSYCNFKFLMTQYMQPSATFAVAGKGLRRHDGTG